MKRTVGRIVLFLLKLAVAGGLMWHLYRQGRLDFGQALALAADPLVVVVVTGGVLLTFLLAAYRWLLLVRCQGIHLSFAGAVKLVFLGMFFNTFLPGGGVGGDVVRIYYTVRHDPQRRAGAVVSIFVDRLLGLYGIILLSVLALAINPAGVLANAPLRVLAVAALGVAVGLPVAAWLANARVHRLFGLHHLFRPVMRGPLGHIVDRLGEAMVLYRGNLMVLFQGVLLSLVSNLLSIVGMVLMALLLHFDALGPVDYLFATSWSLIANTIPISPGGLGVGEAAFGQLCHWLEQSPTAAAYGTLFLTYRFLSLLATLPGVVVYLYGFQDGLSQKQSISMS